MSRHSRLILLAAFAAGCATNPVTGRSELALVSESQEIQMGKEYAEQVKAAYGLYDNNGVQAYVSRLGMQLAAESERPGIPWQFHVIDDAAVNAFALPGGPVFITRGILTHMNSEAELASVLGHEIGHITARHSVRQMSQAQLANLGLGIGSIFSSTVARASGIASAGLSLLFLKYGRDAEKQSDELGFKYMVREGYDPREMASMFETLQRASGGGEGRLPEWLSTHPNPENREVAVRQRIDSLNRDVSGMTVDREEFLRYIGGMTYGVNPREGFFRNGLFLHPDLRFQIQFPNGWQTQNTKQAVAAMSPQQDAILQMTLGQGSPDQAAQTFFGQQGIQSSNVTRNSVNGNPAVSGYFQAQTEQGTLRGIAVFTQYGGNTYQFLGYTPAQAFGQYDGVFRQAIGSFREVTDPAVLNVQPARVELVRVPNDMTIEEFNRRYPSSVPVAQVAIINGVDAGGRLRAGMQAKRVVGGVE
ncbi:MAG TPA: M48 family metalloprotease [Gemmatimonadales bacterium]